MFVKYCSFSENLIEKVLATEPAAGTLFIFPSISSKKRAIREFQKKWQLTTTAFQTMEELKDEVFLSELPILKEEKRTLAFYAALSDEDKKLFRIHQYFQSIELAQHFFELWQEFNEELIDDSQIDKTEFAKYDAELLDWQEQTFKQLLAIRTQYQNFIQEKGFEDIIFLYKPDRIRLSSFQSYTRIVIVNQFYYTRLEQRIIDEMCSQGKQVIIYYQLPQGFMAQPASRPIKPFTLADMNEYKTQQIEIIECSNDFSMIIALLDRLNQQSASRRSNHLVDASFYHHPYSRFLSLAKFNLGTSVSFSSTSIYNFFLALQFIVENITYEEQRQKLLVPLQAVLDAVLINDFFFYFIRQQRGESLFGPAIIQEQTLRYIYSLIELDYKYLDLENEFLSTIDNKPEGAYLQAIVSFVNQFLRICSIADFIAYIDPASDPTIGGGIRIKEIVTPQERHYTNILDIFYRSLSDFGSIEDVGIVRQPADWADYFGVTNFRTKSSAAQSVRWRISAGILQLFNSYMKNKTIHYQHDVRATPRVEVTDIQDTRNLTYRDNVYILNVIEEKIPTARKTPFLFTEKQRQALHLKTYDDIKLWEKYYFFRLVLTTPQVFLFTQKNMDQNIEISSFLEEIKLYFPAQKLKISRVEEPHYAAIYPHILQCDRSYTVNQSSIRAADFYKIVLDAKQDFPSHTLEVTPYSLKVLRDNLFVYYITQVAGVNEWRKEVPVDFSAKLIGNIVHDMINQVWKSLLTDNANLLAGRSFAEVNEQFLNDAIEKMLHHNRSYYYRIPHNHTFIYFDEILLPVIRQGVMDFFQFLSDLILPNLPAGRLTILPEKGVAGKGMFKRLLSSTANALELDVLISGRSDLRIEDDIAGKYYIFDYKTGGQDVDQLIIYELFYYLLDKPELTENVSSYFYHILNDEAHELLDFFRSRRTPVTSKQEILENFQQEISDILAQLSADGFSLPERRSQLQMLAEITRADLYLAYVK